MTRFDARKDGVETTAGFISVSPGTGPVEGATLGHAHTNVGALIRDADVPVHEIRMSAEEPDDGRYACVLVGDEGREVEVDMPGLPLDQVRFLGRPDQNIWDFPRLYVEGSSWVWKFAVNFVRGGLLPRVDGPDGQEDMNPAYDQWTPYDERGDDA